MQLNLYKDAFNSYFSSNEVTNEIMKSVELLQATERIFFIGNGGSNAISSHMMEDYGKVGKFKTFSFSDPALITCYANDYGYENALKEWLKLYLEAGDALIAISSSGNSMNIINAVDFASEKGAKVITLSGFKGENKLREKGEVNFFIPYENYGVVECYHQVITHVILDEIVALREK